MERTRKLRIITGLIAMALIMAVVFVLPSTAFFAVILAILCGAAAEFIRVVRPKASSAPLKFLLVLMPLSAIALTFAHQPEILGLSNSAGPPGFWMLAGAAFVLLSSSMLILFSQTEHADAISAIGILAFGIPYFALPAVSLHHLHQIHPWLAFVLILMVAGSDTAAYFVGSWIGRHKLAPKVSPKKTWEGSLGGLVVSLMVVAVWCRWAFGEIDMRWILLGTVTTIFAQLGDLLESLIKRSTGIKDSSQILPGHGGIYDRADAMLLAAPVFLIGIWLLGLDRLAGNIP